MSGSAQAAAICGRTGPTASGIASQRCQFGAECRGLGLIGQGTVDEQPPDVFQAALLREVDRGVLPVVEETLPTADVAELGLGDHDAGQAAGGPHGLLDGCCHVRQPDADALILSTLIRLTVINATGSMTRVTDELLTAAEAASRLGVKPETLYAYVSRGLLTSARVPGERSSRYPAQEVERLAARATRAGRFARSTPPTVQTRLTLIADGGLSYRGRDAIELASTASYESVAAWLWTGRWRDNVTFPAATGQLDAVRTAAAGMPAQARLADRLRLIVAAAAANDPLRFDIRPEAVTATAANLIGTMVDALPLPDSTARRSPTSLAGRLWSRLTAASPQPQAVEALNAALVVLADHDLAASTVAARVAASIRAHPYAVVSAGLAALDGPLHGAAPDETFRLISDALATDPLSAISERLRLGTAIPGFGHPLYPDGDPRATALLDHVRELPGKPRCTALRSAGWSTRSTSGWVSAPRSTLR